MATRYSSHLTSTVLEDASLRGWGGFGGSETCDVNKVGSWETRNCGSNKDTDGGENVEMLTGYIIVRSCFSAVWLVTD